MTPPKAKHPSTLEAIEQLLIGREIALGKLDGFIAANQIKGASTVGLGKSRRRIMAAIDRLERERDRLLLRT